MNRSRSLFRQCLALFLTMALVLGQMSMITPAFAADVDPTTKIRHRAPSYFVPDHRIKLEADVRDKEGIKLVRCYFRATGEENFVFVGMEQTGSNKFQGILPAPSAGTQELEYLFLAVNNQNQVVKTQTFTVGKDDSEKVPAWQEVPADGKIQVATELETAPEVVAGFQDNIAVAVVESSLRFGVVAEGLYAANAAVGGTSGAAATATSAGAVTAGAGISTTAAVVGGAVAVGAVAGGAAAADGGGGGGSESSRTPDPSPNPDSHPPQITKLGCPPNRIPHGTAPCFEISYYDAGADITQICTREEVNGDVFGGCEPPGALGLNMSGISGTVRGCGSNDSRHGTHTEYIWLIDSQGSTSNTATCRYTVY